MSSDIVLDSSAILCLIRGEDGADAVKAALPRAKVSAVNLAEVMTKMAELGMPADVIRRVLGPLRLQIVPFDEEQALTTGLLRPATRDAGLSLGDRACLALGARTGATVLTTDKAWSEVSVDVAVRQLR